MSLIQIRYTNVTIIYAQDWLYITQTKWCFEDILHLYIDLLTPIQRHMLTGDQYLCDDLIKSSRWMNTSHRKLLMLNIVNDWQVLPLPTVYHCLLLVSWISNITWLINTTYKNQERILYNYPNVNTNVSKIDSNQEKQWRWLVQGYGTKCSGARCLLEARCLWGECLASLLERGFFMCMV